MFVSVPPNVGDASSQFLQVCAEPPHRYIPVLEAMTVLHTVLPGGAWASAASANGEDVNAAKPAVSADKIPNLLRIIVGPPHRQRAHGAPLFRNLCAPGLVSFCP